jgi:hypothetical protein
VRLFINQKQLFGWNFDVREMILKVSVSMKINNIIYFVLLLLFVIGSESVMGQVIDTNNNSNDKGRSNRDRSNNKNESKTESPDSLTEDLEEVPMIGKGKDEEKIELNNIRLQTFEEQKIVIEGKKEFSKKPTKNKADKKDKAGISPPAKLFRVRLQIQNNNPHPMWYLMPYNGAVKLPENGLFEAEPTLVSGNKMINSRKYIGKDPGTELIELLFTGVEKQHFRAFLLPAGGSLLLSNYNIDCWQDAETVEFWAVKELKANNKTDLQDCLPFSVLSSPKIIIQCHKENGCSPEDLEIENKAEVPVENIQFIKADKVSKYLVQLTKG